MEKIIIPSHIDMIKNLEEKIDGVILGLKDYSVLYEKEFSVEEIKKITTFFVGKKVFVSINKNIFNHEIEDLKKRIHELNTLPISGILFYDLSLLHMKKEIKASLIWAQEHFSTNYFTTKYYEKEGVKGVYLSSDITLKEMEDIRKNTKVELMVNVFGYLPIFTSRRHIVDNYKKSFSISEDYKKYYIEKEKKKYPIVDKKRGTDVYSSHILNAACEIQRLSLLNFDYMVFNSFNIEEETFEKVISLFSQITEKNNEEISKKVDILCKKNTDKAFLYKDTIYKVKR